MSDGGDDDEDAVDATTLLSKRESNRAKKVKKDPELLRVQDALEHILAVGAMVRRKEWRRSQFLKGEHQNTPGVTRGKKRPLQESQLCHTEDKRIYGSQNEPSNLSSSMEAFESHARTTESRIDDAQWNLEHGDSIPPILFRMARLSGEYPTEEQLKVFRDPRFLRTKSSLADAHVTLDTIDVPRAMIERCWERAVHAASTTMITPVASDNFGVEESIFATSTDSDDEKIHFDIRTPLSFDECRQKCESLGIGLKEKDGGQNTSCPRCTRPFPNPEALFHHYYGDRETQGCCRALIRPKHLELVRSLLQNHVGSQTEHLLNIVLSNHKVPSLVDSKQSSTAHKEDDSETRDATAMKESPSTRDSQTPSDSDSNDTTVNEPKESIDWKDVQTLLRRAVEESVPTNESPPAVARHPVQESLEMSQSKEQQNLPLVLNSMILEAVHRRLIDRYAHVPR